MQDIIFWPVKAFTGIGCKGGIHRVTVASAHIDAELYLEYSRQVAPDIVVVLPAEWLTAEVLKPRVFHNGYEVVYCGSGAMAAAYCLFQADGFSQRRIQVSLPAKTVTVEKGPKGLSMSVDAALNAKNINKAPYESLLKVEMVECVELAAGYVIVEINSARELKHLKINMNQLARMAGPALIVTALGHTDIKEDYAMRYFAPQFGNDEDSATASANSYLMKYWQLKINKSRLDGRQLSRAGALFKGIVRGSNVQLGGKVAFVD